jgi:hypothetical protein
MMAFMVACVQCVNIVEAPRLKISLRYQHIAFTLADKYYRCSQALQKEPPHVLNAFLHVSIM